MDWIMRILWALGMAVLAWLICIFFGGLLALTHAPLMAYVGAFIVTWAVLIAVLVFIWVFFAGSGWSLPTFTRRP